MKIILSIVGENLEPEQVSRALGGQPRVAGRKGEAILAENLAGKRVTRRAMAGFWQRGLSVPAETDASAALHGLFSDLSENEEVWGNLGRQFRTELAVCGAPRGVPARQVFSVQALELLQRRGVHFWSDNEPRAQ